MTRRCNKSPKYMSEYEHDLTWMAMRYAIGRHTIAAHSICCDMGKNVYGRLSQRDCEFLSSDIRREIAMKLGCYPFNFVMNYDIPTNSDDYRPLSRLIEWMMDNNIETPEDLTIWDEIRYKGKDFSGNSVYEATQIDGPKHYETSDFLDMLEWENLSDLLDVKNHKFCIVLYEGKMEFNIVEYFETYVRESYKTLSFKKVKVPVAEYSENPYVLPTIDPHTIIEADLTKEQIYAKQKELEKKGNIVEMPSLKYS